MSFNKNIDKQTVLGVFLKKTLLGTLVFLFYIFKPNISYSQTLTYTTNLKLWLRADSGIVKNTSNTISAWNDLSGNNNHLTAPSGFEPIFDSINTELNKKSTIKFTGFHYLTFNSPFTIDSFTIFYIGKKSLASNYLLLFGDILLGGGIFNWIDGVTYVQSSNSNSAGLNLGHHTDYSAYTFMFNQLNMKGYKDGVLNSTVPFSYTGNYIFNHLGRSGFYNLNSFGEISEVLVYNAVLSEENRDSVEAYLFHKYSSPVNLGPDISITNSFCDTILSSKGFFTNYLWSTGATTSTISVTKSGKYWLTGTNIFGKQSSDTLVVSYPKFNFKDTTLCAGHFSDWNTNLPKSLFSFLWQDNLSTDSVFRITQAGDYHVKITDNFGCYVESDTITAIIDNFENLVTFGVDTNLCSGNAIYLKQGLQPNLTYTWSTGSNNDSLYITSSGQYSAIVTNSNNCIAKDTINVTVLGDAPIASFLNSIACKNNIVTFSDNSSPPIGNTITSWFWNYGDNTTLGDTSRLQNPFYTYNDTGNYQVNLTVTTDVGCKQTFIKNLHVAPKPTVNFNNIIACQNDSAFFTNNSNSLNYTPLSFQWNFGDPISGTSNTSSLTNPKHLFSQQMIYPVKLITTNSAGCKDSISKNIPVKAQVTANFTNTSPCTNASVIFQDNSIAPAPNNQNIRIWTIGTSTLSGLTATKSFTNPGIYPITLTVNGSNGCVSSITKQIDVKLPPIAELTLNTICLNDTSYPVDLSVPQFGPIISWNWKNNNLLFSTSQTPSLSPTNPGTYDIRLVVVSSDNCRDSMTKQLTVLPLPNVDFTTNPNTFYYVNSPVTFSPNISNGSLYNWTIDGNQYASPITTFTFNTSGTHTATLYMEDAFGCANTKTKNLTVNNFLLDLAIIDIRSTKGSDNFISVEADLANFGTAPIFNYEITYQITDAAKTKENWSGSLNPSGYMTYHFNSKSHHNQSSDFITCVSIGTVNSLMDEVLSNNNLCISSNLNTINVADPYPNPTNGDVNLSVVVPKEMNATIELFDALGQIIYPEYTLKLNSGLNLISIPTSGLSRGSYELKIIIGDKVFVKKVIKTIRD